MAKKTIYDENRIIELYKKYGSYHRAALSAGCAPDTVKKIIIKNNIEIHTYVPSRFNIKNIWKEL